MSVAARRTRIVALLAAAAALLAALAGCSGSSGSGAGGGRAAALRVDADLHADLPPSVRASGELRVVTDASYAPASSFAPDGRTIIGFEPDLAAAIGEVLGVKMVLQNADFSTLPDLVENGHADMIMSAMTDTAEREKRLDFVNYFSAGTSIVVQSGNPHGIGDLSSLCAEKVAVQDGTTQQDLLARVSWRCARPIDVLATATNDDALLLLRTGRVAAILMDYPPAEMLTSDPRTRANYQLATTTQYEPGLYGIGFAKDQQVLRQTVQAALAELVRKGTYSQVLKKWNVSEGALRAISTNAASGG